MVVLVRGPVGANADAEVAITANRNEQNCILLENRVEYEVAKRIGMVVIVAILRWIVIIIVLMLAVFQCLLLDNNCNFKRTAHQPTNKIFLKGRGTDDDSIIFYNGKSACWQQPVTIVRTLGA